MTKFLLATAVIFVSQPVFAYVGPGMAGGVIAGVIGVCAAIFLALWGILYYPIKRALKNKNIKQDQQADPENNKT
jgi:hypothetical protein